VQGSTAACAAAAQLPVRLQCKQGAYQTWSMSLCGMQEVQLQLVRTIIFNSQKIYQIANNDSLQRQNARSHEEVFQRSRNL
jgi:hypothetical protein